MIAKIIAYGRTRDEALGPAAPRGRRDHGGHRGRRDQQELHPRPARPARGDRRHRPTPAGSTGSAARAGWSRTSIPASRWSRPASRRTRTRSRSRSPACSRPRAAAGRRCSTRSAGPSTSSCAAPATRSPCCSIGPHRFRVTVDDRRRHVVDADLERLDAYTSRLVVGGRALPPRHRDATGRSTSSRSTASRTGSAATRAACCARPRRPWWSRRRSAVGDEVAAGAPVLVLESMKMETVLPRAVRGARCKELLVSTGSQVETGAPAGAAGADRPTTTTRPPHRRRRAGRRPRAARRAASTATAAERGRAGLDRPVARCCSASTSTRATRAARWPATSLPAPSSRAEGDVAGRGRDGAARGLRRLRRAEPQPPGRRGAAHREPRAQPARALPHLPAEPGRRAGRPARGVPRAAAAGARATTASPTSTAPPSSRRRCSGSSSPSSARRPTCSWSTALLQRWMTEPAPPTPVADAAAREVLDRLVLATQLRFPVVGDLARSVRFRWFDQPLVDAERAAVLAGVRERGRSCSPTEPDADGPRRADRRAGRDPRADRAASSPSGSRPAMPATRADARGADPAALPRVRAARPARRLTVDGRPFAVADYTPRRPADPPGLDGRHASRAGAAERRWSRALDQRGRRRGRRATRPSSTSTCAGPRRPDAAEEASRRAAARGRRGCRSRRRAPHRGRRRARATDRPVAYFTFRPDRPTAAWSRTTWSAACTRWSAAGSTCGGCATSTSPGSRRPRTCCSTTASPRTTRPTSGWSRWPRSASSPSSATRTAGSLAAARGARGRELPRGDPPRPGRRAAPRAPGST